jgi:hypothetical protein
VGPAGPQGSTGPPGSSDLVRLLWTPSDITNYQSDDPIVSNHVPAAGNYVCLARLTVTNTGASSDTLYGYLKFDGDRVFSASSVSLDPGQSREMDLITYAPLDDPSQPVVVYGEGGGSTTFDIADIRVSLVKLA